MRRGALAILCLTGAVFALACDRAPGSEEPMTAATIVVTGPDSIVRNAAPSVRIANREIAGPSARGTIPGTETTEDPALGLLDPAAPRVVTLAPVVAAAAARKGLTTPSMTLFGGVEQPWRVQVGPRFDLGRKNGLMLGAGTQGQHNRWDLGASATVGERSNVQGIIRYHP